MSVQVEAGLRRMQPREFAERTSRGYRRLVEGQRRRMQGSLDAMGIPGVEIRKGTEIRDARFFDTKKTIGYTTAISPDSLAVLAGTAGNDALASILFIAPSPAGSGILHDRASGRVLTDSFFVAEKQPDPNGYGERTVIRHVRPSQPVHLDTLIIYSNADEHEATDRLTLTEEVVFAVTSSKNDTKDVLRASGINTPRGVIVSDKLDRDKLIERFGQLKAAIGEEPELVFKPDTGLGGKKVVMGRVSMERFAETPQELVKVFDEDALVIEERIVPPPLPKLAEWMNAVLKLEGDKRLAAEDIDWNVRAFTTLGKNPQLLGSFIRADVKSHRPVNLGKGALGIPIDVIDDPVLIEDIHKAAVASAAAVYNEVHGDDDPDSSAFWIGHDIIPNQAGQPYVLEIQTGPGGLGGLAKLDPKLLDTISQVLVPTQAEAVQECFEERPNVDPNNLERIPITLPEKMIQADAFYELGSYGLSQIIFFDVVNTPGAYTDLSKNIIHLTDLATKTGDYYYAYRYACRLTRDFPDNEIFAQYEAHLKVALANQLRSISSNKPISTQ